MTMLSMKPKPIMGTALWTKMMRSCSALGIAAAAAMPSAEQLRIIFVHSAVPMIGFGFMDNMVMIQAGDMIDNTIGVRFGLATLAAAACGQIFSDVSGVAFGGVVEDACARAGLRQGSKRERNSQLQRLISRSFSARFG